MDAGQFMPSAEVVARMRADLDRYESERVGAHRKVQWRVPLFIGGLLAATAATFFYLALGEVTGSSAVVAFGDRTAVHVLTCLVFVAALTMGSLPVRWAWLTCGSIFVVTEASLRSRHGATLGGRA